MARILDSNLNPILDDVISSGTLAALNDAVSLALHGQGIAAFQFKNPTAPTFNVAFEGSVDGVDWQTLTAIQGEDGTAFGLGPSPSAGIYFVAVGGLDWVRVRVASYTSGSVDVAAKAGSGAGTVSLTPYGGDVTNVAGTNPIPVQGNAAHDAAVAGNPVLIAARANTNEPATPVADGDTTHLWADLFGRLVVIDAHPSPEAPVSVNATANGDSTVIAAPGASVRIHVKKASVHNRASATRVVALTDGAGGTVRWRAELGTNGGGSMIDFGSRGWTLTANTALVVNLDAAGDVDVNITEYYLAP